MVMTFQHARIDTPGIVALKGLRESPLRSDGARVGAAMAYRPHCVRSALQQIHNTSERVQSTREQNYPWLAIHAKGVFVAVEHVDRVGFVACFKIEIMLAITSDPDQDVLQATSDFVVIPKLIISDANKVLYRPRPRMQFQRLTGSTRYFAICAEYIGGDLQQVPNTRWQMKYTLNKFGK